MKEVKDLIDQVLANKSLYCVLRYCCCCVSIWLDRWLMHLKNSWGPCSYGQDCQDATEIKGKEKGKRN